MLSTTLIVLLALTGSSSVAARRHFADVRQAADADRAHVEHKVQLHNARMAKRMAQGWEPPLPKSRRSTDPPALAKRQSGSGQADIPLTLIVSAGLDSSWYGNITVGEGSEQTEFGVIFDTGSAGVFLFLTLRVCSTQIWTRFDVLFCLQIFGCQLQSPTFPRAMTVMHPLRATT